MKNAHQKFWPYKPQYGIFITILLLIILLAIVSAFRYFMKWPSSNVENTVLIGILILSALPIVLSVLDVIIERGGAIAYGDVKIDFANFQHNSVTEITIPANIGVAGNAVYDSSTVQILEALKQSVSSAIIIIDLEDGHAWWETRLLVIVAGAERLGKPERIVFLGTEGGKERVFQGWATPKDLLRCLLEANPLYKRIFLMSRAAAFQWQLAEPFYPIPNGSMPPKPIGVDGSLASNHRWMAFDHQTGLPNPLYAEQILQNELGKTIEAQGVVPISLGRLDELFKAVLNKTAMDTKTSQDQQMASFFENDAPFIAITDQRRYSSLVSRTTIINEILKTLVANKQVKE